MDGNSLSPEWPKPAAQNEVYIIRQLKAFHAGESARTRRCRRWRQPSEQDMADVAAYFVAAPCGGETDPSMLLLDSASTGAAKYRRRQDGSASAATVCRAAANAPAGWPEPARPARDLRNSPQLRLIRPAPPTRTRSCAPMAAALFEEEIDAVASYVQGLR